MRTQDYSPPRLTLGVVGVVAIIIPILLGYFLVSGMATSTCYEGLCGTTSTTTTTASSGPSATVAVSIPSGAGSGPSGAPGYSPDAIKVVMGTNNTVVWTNNDSAHHTVTSVSGNGSISSGDLAPGATFNYTFTAPGTYKYICNYHSWMSGTVVVVAGTGAPAPTVTQISIPSGAGSGPSGAPGYSPDKVTLVIGVNNSVVWTNNDSAHHTVTSVSGNGSISSGDLAPGATFNYTFTAPGTYKYICNYHSWMSGTVVVVAGSSSSSNSSSGGIQVVIPSGAGNPSGAPGYSPDKITLVIGVNATVTWINNDSANGGVHHTVTSTSVPTGAAAISSGDMAPGAKYTYTFTVPGTYQYDCVYHPWMTGTVTVIQG
jgi:plastocyanin